ncbi:MAG: aquaporin [Sciscionella sp.]|nr:aquaporin [Sciscionella sp.]
MKKYIAEFVGTLLLVTFAVGSAIFGKNVIGVPGIALTFGLVLVVLAYSLGPISGCHVNPAVTVGLLVARKISPAEAGAYIGAQLLGGIAGAAILKLLTAVGNVKDQTGGFGTDGWGGSNGISNPGGAFIAEIVLTFLLVFTVLLVTGNAAAPGFGGIAIGFSLAVIHLAGIPLDGVSVNPARSLGPALFAGGHALSQVWVFLLAPLVGGVLAALVWPAVRAEADTPAVPAEADAPTVARHA